MIIGLFAVLLTSGVLTWLTKPSNYAPVPSRRKKKNKPKSRLQGMQPYLNDEGFVALKTNPKPMTDWQADR